MSASFTHHAVMLNEALDVLLKPLETTSQRDRKVAFVDATFGRGGHTRALLQRLDEHSRVIVIDRDEAALEVARALAAEDPRVRVVAGDWSAALPELAGMLEGCDLVGVLMDLGVSSPQLDDPERGFSFLRDGPLDMRMNARQSLTAAEWLNGADVQEIARVLREYGEERYSGRIARAISEARPLTRTLQLVEVIQQALPRRDRHKHDATRTFQAVRMFVNSELEQLQATLPAFYSLLTVGGCLVVISFHSVEDRIVKRTFKALAQGPDMDPQLPRRLPVQARDGASHGRARGPISAGAAEVGDNRRARSAKLRVLEKLA